MKRKEFKLPVLHGDDVEQDLLDEGGTGVPAPLPVVKGQLTAGK